MRRRVQNTDGPYKIEHFIAPDSSSQAAKYKQPHTLIIRKYFEVEPTEIDRSLVVWLSDDDVAALIQSMLGIDPDNKED